MLRDYGFGYDELPFDEHGLLPRDKTPKQAWAEHNLHELVEVNRASRQQLLRVPDIGPKSADRIIAARREARLGGITQLKVLGVTAG
jgi:predicted DNA-binding helix-hairpin-helix protein